MHKKKRLSTKRKLYQRKEEQQLIDEFYTTEAEITELLSEHWEDIMLEPQTHARVVWTARKVKELRFLLTGQNMLPRTVH